MRITFLLAEIKGQRGEGSVEKQPPPPLQIVQALSYLNLT